MIMRLLASTAAPTNNAKRSAPSARQRFMPRPRISTEMRPSMPARKRWPCIERWRSFETLALRRLAAAALWNAHRRDSAAHAGGNALLAKEAAIGAIEVRGTAKDATVTLERRRHMNLVGNVSLEHIILGDQSLGAFGEKHLVAELDGRAHFTALDQVGMWLEDRRSSPHWRPARRRAHGGGSARSPDAPRPQ